jgi:hypothetical protein
MNWRARADRLRPLPLPAVLAALAAVRDPHDPAKWHTARGVLSVSGPKFINWNLDWGGGGAIDLVMHLRQVGFGHPHDPSSLPGLARTRGQPLATRPALLGRGKKTPRQAA